MTFGRQNGTSKKAFDTMKAIGMMPDATDRELRLVAALGFEARFPAATKLTETGQDGKEFFILLSGEADCRTAGGEVIRLEPGDWFGEMALIDGMPRTADVWAVTDVSLLVYSQEQFALLLERVPGLAAKMMKALANRLRRSNLAHRV